MNKVTPTNNEIGQFYLHNNDSSLSTIQFHNLPTQVSSVGFNTLKKQATNTSTSSIATSNTTKTNPLTRLFTRNRSSSTIDEEHPHSISQQDINDADSDDEAVGAEKPKQGSGIFNMSRKLKSKLRFTNKAVARPDLSIQTNGHQTLKVPKKILSSTNVEDLAYRKNVTSPVSLHNLFHRPHSQSVVEQQPNNTSNEILLPQQQLNSNPKRTAIGLSSQSSNSFISDLNYAMIYNFTDPDYSGGNIESLSENNTLQDFHRRYMTSADQFVQQKMHRSANTETGLGINNEQESALPPEEFLTKSYSDIEKEISRAFGNLLHMVRPLFLPSKQKVLKNGYPHPQLPMTIEHIANFVQDHIIVVRTGVTESLGWLAEERNRFLLSESQGNRSRHNTMSTTTSSTSSGDNIEDDFIEFKRREMVQELYNFFVRCFQILVKDYNTSHLSELGKMAALSPTKSMDHETPPTRASNFAPKILGFVSESDYLNSFKKNWIAISQIWIYFNTKVRFPILNAFYPLQNYFDENPIQGMNGEVARDGVDIQSVLLIAFRDTVILPHLQQRKLESSRSLLSSISLGDHSKYRHLEFNPLQLVERDYLKLDPDRIYKLLANCFGVISSHLRADLCSSDGELQSRETIFNEVAKWITVISLRRPE